MIYKRAIKRKNEWNLISFSKEKSNQRKLRNEFFTSTQTVLWTNYHAKYFLSLATRVLSKIATFNVIHDLNVFCV